MKNVYTVSEINQYIRRMCEQDYLLHRFYIKGEVSNCKYHTSGHIYFSLKDATGAIPCVMYARNRRQLRFRLQNGQSVIGLGSVSVYVQGGYYQFIAEEIMLEGAGALYEKFEALKRELEEMGMFAPEYKQPIPRYIRKLGVVTAPTGAAIRDIITISLRRNPYLQIILYPALVQGEAAVASIVKGIETLDRYGVDTIIVGRGGGSMEDLWAFNEEIVANAIFQCRTPIISAVGHETDFTIADFVADLRAPTPSGAAELAVDDIGTKLQELEEKKHRLTFLMQSRLDMERKHLIHLQNQIQLLRPQNQLREKRQQLIDKEEKLQYLMTHILQQKRQQMLLFAQRMKGASPLEKLQQGYSYVADADHKSVTMISQVQEGDLLEIYVTDGCIRAAVQSVEKMEYGHGNE